MDSLKNIISDIRIFLYGGITTLPLTIAGTMLILGLFTANYAMLFFLLGFLVLTPLASSILNLIIGAIFEGKSFNPFKAYYADICKLNIPYITMKNQVSVSETNVVSSTWVAMIAFFIGYIFTNGIELYNRDIHDSNVTIESDFEMKINNRKTQAIIAMGSIILFALLTLAYRYYTGCESTAGMIITTILFTFLGHGWYKALAGVGEDRLSDMFGIANRILSPSAMINGPIACLPVSTNA